MTTVWDPNMGVFSNMGALPYWKPISHIGRQYTHMGVTHIGPNMVVDSHIGASIATILDPIWEYSHIGPLHRANTSSFQYGSKTTILDSNMVVSRT